MHRKSPEQQIKDRMMISQIVRKALRIHRDSECKAIEAVSIACEDIHKEIPLDVKGMAETTAQEVIEAKRGNL